MVTNYIISLISADIRRSHINKEFSSKNIKFEFFDAFQPLGKENIIENILPQLNKNTVLTVGEKGCLISHLLLWQKCIDEDMPYISIFEDDVILSEDAEYFLNDYSWISGSMIKQDNFIVRFETFLMPVISEKAQNIAPINGRNICILKSKHYGTAGYIISKNAINYLLRLIKSLEAEDIKPIDQIIFNQLLSDQNLFIYQLSPAICIQELQLNKEESSLYSQIEEDRAKRFITKPKEKMSIFGKILKELDRYKNRDKRKKQRIEEIELENQKSIIPFE
ncbi:glycosyltransferase family 25 protein [Glaesserella parasuis]|uniref:glycosyltransferase family 25 protein n=1 Tax=Glaesserella parasuis TaxID=738 RepID=UPI00042A46D9|nr:glycosyltransferase family 25 protein [Glaesserella parasuis]MDE3964466.1 glycosyltransferase family 25 protein [Glaesserella parasuis]MDG6332275.1 glycosyltransferase family 25 protein [Glaesserella parasuis]